MSTQGDGRIIDKLGIISLSSGVLVTGLLWTLQVAGIWRISKAYRVKRDSWSFVARKALFTKRVLPMCYNSNDHAIMMSYVSSSDGEILY